MVNFHYVCLFLRGRQLLLLWVISLVRYCELILLSSSSSSSIPKVLGKLMFWFIFFVGLSHRSGRKISVHQHCFTYMCMSICIPIYIYILPSRFSSVQHSMMISRSTRLLLQIDYCIGLLVLFLEPIHYRSQKSLSSSGEGIGSVHLMATNC